MKYFEYEKAFSQARLNKYYNACSGNTTKALSLYRYNIKLCQKFYGILNIFEIVLRNAINDHYKSVLSDSDWIKSQLSCGGMLENIPQKNEVLRIIQDLSNQGRYTNDRVVASVSFGFWSHLFTRQPYRLGGQNLLRIFPNRTTGLGQRAIFNELMSIKTFRNRIAHHEAICFNASGVIDISNTQDKYQLILKYIHFLGYDSNHLLWGIDIFPNSIMGKIASLKKSRL